MTRFEFGLTFILCAVLFRQARRFGYVSTLSGRRRYLPEINSSDSSKKATAERQAVNTVIQGTASDIIKLAMLRMESSIDLQQQPQLLLQIHDELIFEVSEESEVLSQFITSLRHCMETYCANALSITVPLIANVHVGRDWGSLEAYSCKPEPPPLSPRAATRPSLIAVHAIAEGQPRKRSVD